MRQFIHKRGSIKYYGNFEVSLRILLNNKQFSLLIIVEQFKKLLWIQFNYPADLIPPRNSSNIALDAHRRVRLHRLDAKKNS